MRNFKVKNIIYTLCFAFLCLIDQRVKTAENGVFACFRDMNFIVVAILVLSHYRLQDFKKHWFLYMSWLLLCIVGGGLFIWKGEAIAVFLTHRVVLVTNLFLWGIALIRTVVRIFAEKQSLTFIRKAFACVWLLMMVGMLIFLRGIHWMDAYLIVFGTYYLTDYSDEERNLLFQGILNGVILGFFLMQGWCFVFRPYDTMQYSGAYISCNSNVLFYLMVLAVILTKLLYVYKVSIMRGNQADTAERNEGDRRWIFLPVTVRIWYWLLAGAVLGLIVLTIGRTGYLVAVILVLVAALMRWEIVEKQWNLSIVNILKSGMIISLCFFLTFPVVFGAVRYIPPIFHHPVFFFGEDNEKRIHFGDSWNSEKYTDFEELLDMIGFRLQVVQMLMKTGEGLDSEGAVSTDTDMSTVLNESLQKPSDVTDLQWECYLETLAEGYAINLQEFEDSYSRKRDVMLRSSIYRYYIHRLNWKGYPISQQRFQILPDLCYSHAHNIYLQWGINYGIPVMILFIVLILWTIGHLIRCFRVSEDPQYAGYLLLFLVPCLFGILEYCWGDGSLTISMMFITWGRVMCKSNNKVIG